VTCLVLAAGYATRLYPLTEFFPKPLLKVNDKTILDWLLDDVDALRRIDRYVIITNSRYYRNFIEWASGKRLRAGVCVLNDGTLTNETRLGAVNDIQFAIDALGIDDDLLILAGDNLLDFSLEHFLNYCGARQTSCVMRYFETDRKRLRKSGVASVDDNGRVARMEEKPAEPSDNWCIPPFYYLRRDDVHLVKKAIEDGCKSDAPGSLIAWLSNIIPVHALEMPGKRYDIGDYASYQAAQDAYRGIK